MHKTPALFEDKTPDFVACARFWRSSRGNTEGVLKDLPRRGFYNSPSRLRRQDIDKSRSTSRNHRHIAGGRSSARAVAVVDYESPSAVKSLLESEAHCFITKPIRPSGIVSSLLLARSLHGYQSRLLAKVNKLEETLRSRREIERATQILMEMKRLDEDAAYQLIRSQATSQRLGMGAVARSIITAHRVFDSTYTATSGPKLARKVLGLTRR